MGDYSQARRDGEMRRRQRGREDFSRRDEEGAESRLHGRLEASKESWRDEEMRRRQRIREDLSRIHGEMRRGRE